MANTHGGVQRVTGQYVSAIKNGTYVFQFFNVLGGYGWGYASIMCALGIEGAETINVLFVLVNMFWSGARLGDVLHQSFSLWQGATSDTEFWQGNELPQEMKNACCS